MRGKSINSERSLRCLRENSSSTISFNASSSLQTTSFFLSQLRDTDESTSPLFFATFLISQSDKAIALEFRLMHKDLQAQHLASSSLSKSLPASFTATRTDPSVVGSEWTEVERDHRGGGQDASAARGEGGERRGQVAVGEDVW